MRRPRLSAKQQWYGVEVVIGVLWVLVGLANLFTRDWTEAALFMIGGYLWIMRKIDMRTAYRTGWREGFVAKMIDHLSEAARARQVVTGDMVPEPWEALGISGVKYIQEEVRDD